MIIYVLLAAVGILFFASIVLFIRLRNQQQDIVAYGLRTSDEGDDNTRTNITEMESGFTEAMTKLEQLGEVKQDQWGGWIWTSNGESVGGKNLLG